MKDTSKFSITDKEFLQKTFILKLEEFVVEVYRTYLNRDPDPEGKRLYVQNIREDILTRDELLELIRQSPEFKQIWEIDEPRKNHDSSTEARASKTIFPTELTIKNNTFDSDSLANDSYLFWPYIEVLQNTHPSKIDDEYFLNSTHHLSDEDFLQAVYLVYLKRNLDDLGKDSWCKYLKGDHFRREWLLKYGIRGSPEFKVKWTPFDQKLLSNLVQLKKAVIKTLFP